MIEIVGSLSMISLWNIYFTAWADYINGSVSGNAILNFESMRVPVVLLCVAVAFWPENDDFDYA